MPILILIGQKFFFLGLLLSLWRLFLLVEFLFDLDKLVVSLLCHFFEQLIFFLHPFLALQLIVFDVTPQLYRAFLLLFLALIRRSLRLRRFGLNLFLGGGLSLGWGPFDLRLWLLLIVTGALRYHALILLVSDELKLIHSLAVGSQQIVI